MSNNNSKLCKKQAAGKSSRNIDKIKRKLKSLSSLRNPMWTCISFLFCYFYFVLPVSKAVLHANNQASFLTFCIATYSNEISDRKDRNTRNVATWEVSTIVFNECLWPFFKQLETDHLTPNKRCLYYTIVTTLYRELLWNQTYTVCNAWRYTWI